MTQKIHTHTLPTGLTYQSCFASPGVCSGLGNQRTITFGTIAPNATASISLSATITPSAGETVTNTATVTSYSTDPNVSNNSSAATSYRTLPAATADSNTVPGALARIPNGRDTDDAAADWAFTSAITQGAANVP